MRIKNKESLRIAIIYLLISLLWIIFSDKLLLIFTQDIDVLTSLQTVKGWFFVVSSAIVIHFLVRSEIYKKKLFEQKLEIESVKYKTLFETANDAILIVNKKNQFEDCNKKTLKLLNCSKDQIIGKSVFYIAPEYQSKGIKSEEYGLEKLNKAWNDEPQGYEWVYTDLEHVKRYYCEVSVSKISFDGEEHLLILARNIDEKKLVENQLKETTEKYRKQYDYFPVPIFTLKKRNGEFYFADINNISKEFPYIKSGDIIGENLDKFFYRKEDQLYFDLLENILRTKKTKSIETTYEFKTTKKKRHLKLIAGYIPDQTILISLFDITDSKKAESKLRESEEKFRMHYSNLPIPTYTWQRIDNDFVLIEHNDAAEKETKGSMNEFVGKKLSNIYGHRKDIIKDITGCSRDNKVRQKEMLYVTTKGEEKYFSVTYVPVSESFVIVHTENITSRTLIKKALKQSEEKYRRLTENSPDISYMYSMNNGAMYWSSRVKDILGFDPNKLTTETLKWDDAIHPDDQERIKEFFKHIEPGEKYELEYRIFDTDNKMHWFKDRIFNVYRANGDVILEGLISDITESKNSQKKVFHAMMNAEERERARVAKELHDGVSPILSAIKLYIQTLLNAKDQNVQKDISQKIYSTINDAVQSVSDISNRLSPHILKNFGLGTALQSYIEKISETTMLHFSFLCNIKSELEESIEVTLYRIAVELINNTIKYASASNVAIKINEKKEYIEMFFEDNGKGYDQDSVSKSSKGMGLFNIKNRINSLNGKLSIKTSVEKGLRVEISIPKI